MKPLALISLIISLSIAATAQADRLRQVELGQPLPAFELKTLDGQTINSQQFADTTLVLVFLTADQERSAHAAAQASAVINDLNGQKLSVVFVTADTGAVGYFEDLADQLDLAGPIALDFDRQLYGKLGLIVLPTTIIAGPDSGLRYVLSGYRHDYAHLLDTHLQNILGMIDNQQMEDALTARRYEVNAPTDRAARHRAAARLLTEKGLYTDAATELKAAMELSPDDPEIQLDLVALRLHEGDLQAAAQTVDQVLQTQPDHRRALTLGGIVRFRQDDLPQAENMLLHALELNPQPARVRYYLGRVYEAKGEMEKAVEQYRQGLARVLDEPAE